MSKKQHIEAENAVQFEPVVGGGDLTGLGSSGTSQATPTGALWPRPLYSYWPRKKGQRKPIQSIAVVYRSIGCRL